MNAINNPIFSLGTSLILRGIDNKQKLNIDNDDEFTDDEFTDDELS